MGNSAYFLVGPTASGKSALAHKLAQKKGWSVVSADSMNLYRGMDIGTAKPSVPERTEVPYAGIDLVNPTEKFSVAAWLKAVAPAWKTEKTQIVAGGTGLYIKCLTEGLDPVPPENPTLRAELETLSFSALEQRAQQDATELYNSLPEDDKKNPRRLIRILEKMAAGQLNQGSWNSQPKPRLVGLRVERETLHRRIAQRVEQMYAEGLLEEAALLIKQPLSSTALQAIGYAEAFAVLRGETSVEEAKERTTIRTRQLAKRQMTWMRNQLNVEWVDTEKFASTEELAETVLSLWEQLGPAPIRIDGAK